MKKLLFLLLALSSALAFAAGDFKCSTATAKDGDTIKCGNYDVRLAAADAPEKKQDYGMESKAALQALLDEGKVTVHWLLKDKYRRYVGIVFVKVSADKTKVANFEQIKYGNAWYYDEYPIRADEYEKLNRSMQGIEVYARSQRLGLWSLPTQVYPQEWRRSH